MTTFFTQKNSKNFDCEVCGFKCCNKNDYNRHILTRKHKILQNTTCFTQKNSEVFTCSCGKEYKHHSSLWNHRKKCPQQKEIKTDPNSNDKELIMLLIKENSELKNMMMKVIENGTTNVTNNTNNSHNKTFNLQLFLNETCKDAMNIMDFVDSIKIQLADMESIGELGFVNGMSKLIIKNLKALDENMRPVHCSDPKRDTMYVKDSNVWEKEDSENMKIKKAIKYIAHKNICALPQWRDKYPDCVYSDSKKSDQYNHIVLEAMGGSGDNDEEKASKIVKKIAKEVVIDKNSE
jgi:hypothetical protein